MRWMRDRHADHPIQGEAGCGRGLQRKLAETRQLGAKNLNLGLTTTMNELLIGFAITSAGFGPLASAPGQEPTSWVSRALAVPPIGKTIAVT
jgi:hypothetical protein